MYCFGNNLANDIKYKGIHMHAYCLNKIVNSSFTLKKMSRIQ